MHAERKSSRQLAQVAWKTGEEGKTTQDKTRRDEKENGKQPN